MNMLFLTAPRDVGLDWFPLLRAAVSVTNVANTATILRFVGLDASRERIARDGSNLLREALGRGGADNVTLLWFLLEAGADLHRNGEEILVEAAQNGFVLAVEMFLANGAKTTCRRNLCAAILQPSTRDGIRKGLQCNPRTLRMLLKAGADIHYRNDMALRAAAKLGRSDLVRVLLEAGADVHAPSGLLMAAVEGGDRQTVQLLLLAGANVEDHNEGALRRAVQTGRPDLVRLLLSWGARVPVSYDLGLICGNAEVVKGLERAGNRERNKLRVYGIYQASFEGGERMKASASVVGSERYLRQLESRLRMYEELMGFVIQGGEDARQVVERDDGEGADGAREEEEEEAIEIL
ncbi:hypothetical protein HDV00_000157 [Rhizophlyctis rosea]|nr:hypothetical protein HDV00_000157 [Rhizophlyctis rosea]